MTTDQTLRGTTAGRWLSAAEAAQVLAISKVQVTRLAKAGALTPAGRLGNGVTSALVFTPEEVDRLRRIRSGEAGDVLDRVDVDAAGKEPSEDRNAATRAEWLAAIGHVAKRNGGKFHSGQVRPFVSEGAHGPAVGALISGLVRRGRIEHTGEYAELRDTRNRHGMSPCKVYRVTGALS